MKKQKNYSLLLLLFVLAIAILASSFTENQNARHYGGTETINLGEGQRVVNVTWKEGNIWILTRQDTTIPTTYTFQEKSNWGMMEGKVILIEK